MGFDSSVSRLLRSPAFGRIEDGARLALAAETEALRLDLDGQRVRAVTVRDRRSGETFAIPARHVMLAGGCVQSVRLAMASGLDRDDPMIGRYMGDHLFRQGDGQFGVTSAIGVVMVLLLLVLSWGYVRTTLKEEEL